MANGDHGDKQQRGDEQRARGPADGGLATSTSGSGASPRHHDKVASDLVHRMATAPTAQEKLLATLFDQAEEDCQAEFDSTVEEAIRIARRNLEAHDSGTDDLVDDKLGHEERHAWTMLYEILKEEAKKLLPGLAGKVIPPGADHLLSGVAIRRGKEAWDAGNEIVGAAGAAKERAAGKEEGHPAFEPGGFFNEVRALARSVRTRLKLGVHQKALMEAMLLESIREFGVHGVEQREVRRRFWVKAGKPDTGSRAAVILASGITKFYFARQIQVEAQGTVREKVTAIREGLTPIQGEHVEALSERSARETGIPGIEADDRERAAMDEALREKGVEP